MIDFRYLGRVKEGYLQLLGRGGAPRGQYGAGHVAPTCRAGRFRGYLPIVRGRVGAPMIRSRSAPLPSLCRNGFELILCGEPVVLWVCGGYEFCAMVTPWVSDLLLVVVGCWRGVGWPCGLPAYVAGEGGKIKLWIS